MGRTRATKQTIEISPVRTRGAKNRDPDVVGQVTKQVTAEFAPRFARIERAIEAIAGLNRDDASPPPKRRKAAPKPKEAAQPKQKPTPLPQVTSSETPPVTFLESPEILATHPRQTLSQPEQPPLLAQPPSQQAQPELVTQNVNKTWSTWLADNIAMNPPRESASALPLSAKEVVVTDDLESKVHDILTNTATRLAKGNNKTGQFPFQYVQRGPEKRYATMNSLTINEHIWGIVCMIKDPQVPSMYKPALFDHIEQICDDCRDYDWSSAVRRWSEEVFTLVSQNRLEKGWLAKHDIQMLRLSLSRDSSARISQHKDLYPPRARQTATQPIPLEALRGGPPCPDFNSSRGCTLTNGHVAHGKKMLHICSFCLMNSAATFPHPEVNCRNKNRTFVPHFQY